MQPFIRWFKAETKKALTSRLVELWLKWRQIFIMLFQFSDKTFRLWIIPSDGWSGNGVNGQDYPVEISMWRHDTGNCQSSQPLPITYIDLGLPQQHFLPFTRLTPSHGWFFIAFSLTHLLFEGDQTWKFLLFFPSQCGIRTVFTFYNFPFKFYIAMSALSVYCYSFCETLS